jgi:methyl coenzyme M reductase alpha subunit
MKITIEQYEHTITYQLPHNDVNMEEMLEILERLLKCTGFVFSGNLEIVDEWSDNEETFKQQEQ